MLLRPRFLLCAVLCVASLSALAQEAEELPDEVEGAKDHPGFKRFPGTVMTQHKEREFESFAFPRSETTVKKAEGKYFHATYYLPRKTSCTQWLRNYENAFKAVGLKTAQSDTLPDDFEIEGNRGKWVSADGKPKGGVGELSALAMCEESLREAHLVIVEKQAMEQKVEITAEGLADEIQKSGHVAVYGIVFATGKATIEKVSEKVLTEVGKILADHADWKLKLEGHTDNVGAAKANLELSKKRAAAVKDWLVKNAHVDGKRLSTDGYGDTKPVGPNDTEEGRGSNRRVELVKL